MQFDASLDEVEDLLKTEYYVFEHTSGNTDIACDEYETSSRLVRELLLANVVSDITCPLTSRSTLTTSRPVLGYVLAVRRLSERD